jgi:GT2 family glycosyltransferase
MSDGEVDVVVIAVTWNSSEVIAGLIDSVPGAMCELSWSLVVVDNASSDATLEIVATSAPDATVLQLGRNAGYAAGINAGLRGQGARKAVLVVNPDVRLDRGCVRTLVEALTDPTVGVAVPSLRDASGRLTFSQHRDPTVFRALGDALLGGGRAGRLEALGETVTRPESYASSIDVDWASGAVMALSTSCVEAVGNWDESFWLYSEETDYCLRARALGYRVRYISDARAVHLEGDTHADAYLWTTLTLNRVRLYRRGHGRLSSAGFQGAVMVNEALRGLAGRRASRTALAALVKPISAASPGPITP